jgi:hypothetical protein
MEVVYEDAGWALRTALKSSSTPRCNSTPGTMTAAHGERRRLANLDHAPHVGVERSGGGFLAVRLLVLQALKHIEIWRCPRRAPLRPATEVMNEMRGGG